MSGLFDGTSLERPVTCSICNAPMESCGCPRNAFGDVLLPKDQPVRIRREKRKNGKAVTVITGLDPNASDIGGILTKLKNACAAGGTITDGVTEIQGDHRELALTVLRDLGYDARNAGG